MRFIGLGLIMFFSCGVGIYFADREKRKLALCGEICCFLDYLAHAVSSGRKIDDVIRRFCKSGKGGIIKADSKTDLIDFLESLSFDEKFNKLILEIRVFLEDLGHLSSSEKESERCTNMLANMRDIYQKYKADYEKKDALYIKLGFICGIIICIVLI